MTSKQECFVYISLPDETEMVTAGKFQLSTTNTGLPLGRFVYGKSYMARPNAVEIDPIDLRLSTKQYETISHQGIFGALRDASPDYWGRRLIELHAGKAVLSEMDYLLFSPEDRMGALGFGYNATPPAPLRRYNRKIQLRQLQHEAEAITRGDYDSAESSIRTQVEELLLMGAGTSMGGARPKAVVEDENTLWVAKFNSEKDPWNNARVEMAMMQLAARCGVHTAQCRVENIGNQDFLLVKRFDRETTTSGYLRHRMISALSALGASDNATERDQWSYMLLVDILRKISSNAKGDSLELYRRMVFNALISNNDDHLRNHAFLASNSSWRISPAYDLTPNPLPSIDRRDLALTCGAFGRYANRENLISQSTRFLLTKEDATHIFDEMHAIVSKLWYSTARAAGVTVADCAKIEPAFLYPGLFYTPN